MIFYGFIGLFILNYLITLYVLSIDSQYRKEFIKSLNTSKKIKMYIIINILTCIIEELIFRHYLDNKCGIMISSFLFGIYHVPVIIFQTKKNIILLSVLKFFLTFSGGYLLSHVNIKYTLINSIIYHILYNLSTSLFIHIKMNSHHS